MAADNYSLTVQVWWVIIHPLAGAVLEAGQPDTLGVQEFQTSLGSIHCLYFLIFPESIYQMTRTKRYAN